MRHYLSSLAGGGRRFVLFIVLFPLFTFAQSDFTQLNWNELRIDSVLPVYSEVVPLETDYRMFTYSVKVRYPEWAPLTESETDVVARYSNQIADTLSIESHVGVSRGSGMLDIAFVPIISRDGHYEKLISCKIEIVPTVKGVFRHKVKSLVPTASASSSRWASASMLSQGRWVKISIQANGIYHLTHSALSGMGFSNPSKCRVYGYGGHLQNEELDADNDFDDLEEVSLWPVADGFLFYANGLSTYRDGKPVVNHYAREACYFVTETSSGPSAFPTQDATPSTSSGGTATIRSYASYNPQDYAWFQGGRQLFEGYDYYNGSARNYTLNLPCPPVAGDAYLTVSFSAANDESTKLTTSFNGTSLGTQTISGLSDYTYAVLGEKSYAVSTPQLSNTVRLSTTAGRHARLNYLSLSYLGQLSIDKERRAIAFDFQPSQYAGEVVKLSYVSGQQPQLWRLAERGKPTTALNGTSTATDGKANYRVLIDNDGAEHRYVAFDAAAYSSYPQPTVIGQIANQNLHGLNDIEMVIITPASGIYDAQAERLAAAHREVDGMNVAVVRADCIYNEFSSGTPDATAYRRFMKMLYDRASDALLQPRYLLLFGDCAWDNRMLTSTWKNFSPNDFLLCFESENSVSDVRCYVMEDYFGLLDDGEGKNLLRDKTDLGVGRFPVRNVTEATALVNKTIAYLRGENAGAWKNVVCFLGDDGDNNEHLIYTDAVANQVEKEYPQLEVRKVMWDTYKREVTSAGNRYPQVKKVVARQMAEGALMMNYTGHGATYCLSHEHVFELADFKNYSSPRMPLWLTAACDVMPFDTQKDNLGETAILNPNGAAVAFIGTSRTVYAHKNLELNRYFCNAIFGEDELGRSNRVGDAMRLCKSKLAGTEAGYLENKLHYALLGDPALTFGSVKNQVLLNSINGVDVNELPADFMLHAGSKARLVGTITDENGTALTDFKGTITVRLYDSESTITCLNNNSEKDGAFTYKAYDKILYNGQDSVRNGRFELTCPVPIDIHYSNEPGRLILYAVGADRRTEARGFSEDFLLGGTEPGLITGNGPHIFAYLNDEGFENGQTVNSSPFFIAQLQDDDGINAAGNGLGHDLELIIDGDATQCYVLNDYYVNAFGDYTRGHLAYSIPTLSEGPHTLLFRAWDTLNNPSSTTLSFEVDRSLTPSILKLTTSVNPARSYTQFLLNYNRPGTTCQFTIDVFDFSGRLLWTHTETGSNDSGFYSIPWNLTTGGGFPLGSGIYLYRARVSCDDSEEATEAQKLIINRRQ